MDVQVPKKHTTKINLTRHALPDSPDSQKLHGAGKVCNRLSGLDQELNKTGG